MPEMDEHVANIKMVKFEAPNIKEWEYLHEKSCLLESKTLLSGNIFHTNPLNVPKIQTVIYTYS